MKDETLYRVVESDDGGITLERMDGKAKFRVGELVVVKRLAGEPVPYRITDAGYGMLVA